MGCLFIVRFARVCRRVDDFNARNKCFTAKLFKHDYRYHKLRKAFSKFYRRPHDLVSKLSQWQIKISLTSMPIEADLL